MEAPSLAPLTYIFKLLLPVLRMLKVSIEDIAIHCEPRAFQRARTLGPEVVELFSETMEASSIETSSISTDLFSQVS